MISWLQLSPVWWFALAFASAVPLLVVGRTVCRSGAERRGVPTRRPSPIAALVNVAVLAALAGRRARMARGAIWSPYYKITVGANGPDTVVEVNNIFHQSMAPVEQKEYFYQWPYAVFGDSFDERPDPWRRLRH